MYGIIFRSCGEWSTEKMKKRILTVKRLSEYLFLGTLGGTLYYTFEVIFRGYSHWSMFLLGGLCLTFFA